MFLALCSYHFNALEEKIVLSVEKVLLINFVLNFVLFRHIFLLSCKTLDYLLKRKQLTAIIYRLNFDLLLSSDCLQVPKEQWLEQRPKNRKSFRPIGLWLVKWSFNESCLNLVHRKLGFKSGRRNNWTREIIKKSIRPVNKQIASYP